MSTTSWSGAVSGDYSNASNWSNAVPIAGSDVIINTGSRNIDAGLAQSAVDLTSFYVGPLYTGGIGNSDTAPLLISSAKVTIAGGGDQHYIVNATTNIDDMEIIKIGPSGTGRLTTGGTILKLTVRMGHIKLYSGTQTLVYLQAEGGLPSSASITQFAGTVTTFFKAAGDFTTEDVDADGVAINGTGTVTTLEHNSGSTEFGPSATLTNLIQWGGNVVHKASATITLARIIGGIFDGRFSRYSPTITTLDVLSAGQALFDGAAFAPTITNQNNYGGSVTF